jgi:hypothetical protein
MQLKTIAKNKENKLKTQFREKSKLKWGKKLKNSNSKSTFCKANLTSTLGKMKHKNQSIKQCNLPLS